MSDTSWTNRTLTYRCGSSTKLLRFYTNVANLNNRYDDVSVKALSLPSLFSTVDTSDTDVIASVDITMTAGTQAGIVIGLDDATNPTKFLIAYHNGTNVRVEQLLSGTYSTIVTAVAGPYADGRTLTVIKDGTTVRLYYNNLLIGTGTCSASITGTRHGLFSTYSGNSFDNFTVFPRGTSITNYNSAPFQTSGDSTPAPTFSAIYTDYDLENSASYQLQVNTAADFSGTNMWDSTKQSTTVINGARSANITYAGTALPLDGSTYYWRIKFWDVSDVEGYWSTETASFTMKKGETLSCYLSKATNGSSITVKWKDTNNFEDGYKIQKKIDSGAFTDLVTQPLGSTSYQDNSVPVGHTYTYKVAFSSGSYTGSWCTTDPAAVFNGGIQIY